MEIKINVTKYNEVYSGDIQRLLDLGARIIKNEECSSVGVALGRYKSKYGEVVAKSTDDICINNVTLPLCMASKDYCDRTITIHIETEE